jgi:hypothetical protein
MRSANAVLQNASQMGHRRRWVCSSCCQQATGNNKQCNRSAGCTTSQARPHVLYLPGRPPSALKHRLVSSTMTAPDTSFAAIRHFSFLQVHGPFLLHSCDGVQAVSSAKRPTHVISSGSPCNGQEWCTNSGRCVLGLVSNNHSTSYL